MFLFATTQEQCTIQSCLLFIKTTYKKWSKFKSFAIEIISIEVPIACSFFLFAVVESRRCIGLLQPLPLGRLAVDLQNVVLHGHAGNCGTALQLA